MPTKRNLVTGKPAKPATAKPAQAAPAVPAKPADAVAKPARGVTRTVATIARQRTNFGDLSDRDNAYLAFYAGIAKRGNGTVTVAAIAEHVTNPLYSGSNKAHDAGVIVRLGKAGLIDRSADSASFTFTAKAKTLSAYAGAR